MPYVTRTELRTHIGLTGARHDSELDILINAASEACDRYTGRTFGTLGSGFFTHAVTDNFDLDRDVIVRLRSWPVLGSLTSISLSGSSLAATDYRLDSRSGLVRMIDGVGKLLPRTGHLAVTYNAGYATAPYEVQLACLRLGSYWFQRKGSEGVSARLLGDIQETWRQPETDKILGDTLGRLRLDAV